MGCPSCGFTSDPETGAVFDTTFPCSKCGKGGATVLTATLYGCTQTAAPPARHIVEALYHHERGRKFRPTQQEMLSKRYNCPYCAVVTVKVRLRNKDYGYSCPRCHWTIHRDDIYNPQQGKEPEIREDGDATRDPPASLDISVKDMVVPDEAPVIVLS